MLKKNFLVCLLLIVPLSLVSFSPYLANESKNTKNNSANHEAIHLNCLYPTVKVQSVDGRASGSGVIIKSKMIKEKQYLNIVLTCAHVLLDDMKYTVMQGKYQNWSEFIGYEKPVACEIYYKNNSNDVAVLLFLSEEELPTAELGIKENIYISNDVFKVGCGGDSLPTPPRMDRGIITSILNLGSEFKIIRTSAFTVPGDSGGPLYHDNKLIGLIRAIRILNGRVLAYKISFAVSTDIIPVLDKEVNNALSFIYNDEYKPPVIPSYRLQFDRYERIIDL